MPTLQTPFSYERLNPVPLDVSAVFDNLAAFTAYLAGPVAYVGQIVAVRNATNEPDIYRINEDKSYSTFGGGGGGTLAGDVTGSSSNTTVARIRGRNVATTTPANGQALVWNQTADQWQPTPMAGSGVLAGDVTGATTATVVERLRGRIISTATPANGTVLTYSTTSTQWAPQLPGITALTTDVTGTGIGSVATTVTGLQRRPISTTAPTNGQVLAYNGASGQWVPTQVSGGTITLAGDVTGVSSSTVVANIRGRPVSTGTPQVNQVLTWGGGSWYPTTRTLFGDVWGNWNTTRVDRLRNRPISLEAPQIDQAYRWSGTEWVPEDVGEPTYMLDGPPRPGQLKFGQLGCEYKATPIRLWIGVPKDVNNMESRLLIGTAPAPTIWDGGATTFDGGATTWDVFTP